MEKPCITQDTALRKRGIKMKFLTICIEQYGETKLPRIERVITAKNEKEALKITQKDYPQYENILVYEWIY